MLNHLFISHSTLDREVVEILCRLIKRVSLDQIRVWYSSDEVSTGGLTVNDDWFNVILDNIKKSQAVVTFITPNSNAQPWILFESGYARALDNTMLIPLKFLINFEDISAPFRHKQVFGFSNVAEANLFLTKVLGAFRITYDKEAFHEFVDKSIKEMRETFISKPSSIDASINNYDVKLDRLLNLLSDLIYTNETPWDYSYEIPIEFYVSSRDTSIVEYIRINRTKTFGNVLDEIYFFINGSVKAYTYMEEWILEEKSTEKRLLVISDVQDYVPAYTVLKRNSLWRVKLLKNPYRPNNAINQKNTLSREYRNMVKEWGLSGY